MDRKAAMRAMRSRGSVGCLVKRDWMMLVLEGCARRAVRQRSVSGTWGSGQVGNWEAMEVHRIVTSIYERTENICGMDISHAVHCRSIIFT
jgi:hypothetical protein